ncbi:hypothetical protein AAG906_006114 [Vitis piasezkii]
MEKLIHVGTSLSFQLSGFPAQSIFELWSSLIIHPLCKCGWVLPSQDPSQMLKQDRKSYYKFTFKGRICSVGPVLGLLPNGHKFESP